MANSYIEYTTGLTGTSFSGFNIKYISQGHLKVLTSTNNGTSYTSTSLTVTVSGTTATLSGAPSTGSDSINKIRIYRDTGTDQLVDFQNGSRLSESDLDTAYQQGLYAAQEVIENAPFTGYPATGAQGIQGVAGTNGTNGTNGTEATLAAGAVLETFTLPCNGQTITVGSGTYTMPDQDSSLALTTAYQDLAASQISYTPPSGTQLVVYEFLFNVSRPDDNPIGNFKLFIDGAEVTDKRTVVYNKGGGGMQSSIKWGFQIGGSAVASTGRVASWTSAKTIKVTAREYGSNDEATLYTAEHMKLTDNADTLTTVFIRPQLSITAIK